MDILQLYVYSLIKKSTGTEITPEQIEEAVEKYLIKNPIDVKVDKTLTQSGMAADAKIAGEKISALKEDLTVIKEKTIIEKLTKTPVNPIRVFKGKKFSLYNGKYSLVNDAYITTLAFKISKNLEYTLRVYSISTLYYSYITSTELVDDMNGTELSDVNDKLQATNHSGYITINYTALNDGYIYIVIYKEDSPQNKFFINQKEYISKTDINLSNIDVKVNYYVATNNDTIDINNFVYDDNYVCAVLKCKENDKFVVSGSCGNAPRLWAFVNNDGFCLRRSNELITENELELIAPKDSSYAIFNSHKEDYDFNIVLPYSLMIDSIENKIMKNTKNISILFENIKDCTGYYEQEQYESIPVNDSALTYNRFIDETWEKLRNSFPKEITKKTICKDTSGEFDIYKYVFQPKHFTKTVFLCAGMHGNEYEGFWGLYQFMKLLYTQSYKIDVLRNIRHTIRFVIIPVLNPYGVEYKQRFNSVGIDPNYNYDVRFDDPDYKHSGEYPFQYNEVKAVKSVLDEYPNKISLHLEFHTDPYQDTIGNYAECLENSVLYDLLYDLTIDNRAYLKEKYSFSATYGNVIYPTKGSNCFRYMEEIHGIPSAIIEANVGFFAEVGTKEQMKSVVDWYTDVIKKTICFVNQIM